MPIRVFSLLLALVALTPGMAAQTRSAPKDFAFRLFRYSCDLTDELNTFSGKYIRGLGNGKHAIAKVVLSSKQKDDLYRRIQEASFFNYPTDYSPPGLRFTEPSMGNSLTVRSSGITHTVRIDFSSSEDAEAVRYQELISGLWEFFESLPSVKRLPPPIHLCM
jgi:hypothetical protein